MLYFTEYLMKSIAVLLITLSFGISQENCTFFNKEYYLHLGTKTPYRVIANTDENVVSFDGCQASKIFGLIRHGTRTPGFDATKEIQKVLSELKASILEVNNQSFRNYCNSALGVMKNWSFWMDTEGEKVLTTEGGEEMILLAKRLQKRFPSLLPSKFRNDTFLFRFTKTQRTEESAKHFSLGLFGKDSNEQVWFPQPQDPDPVLRFYKLCKRWRNEVKKSPASVREREQFIKSDEVHELLQNISDRLGLNYTLSFDTVWKMYLSCSFETAWSSKRISPWCFVFSKGDLKVLEYADELKYYWRDGYGFDINHKQSCPLFKSIMEFLQNTSGDQKALFYFTHSGTMLKALSRLGLYKDNFILTADLDKVSRENRRWRVSHIDTFGSNLIFVLFRCENEGEKVLVTHQEKQVQIPGCPELPQLCPITTIKNLLSSDLTCNFTEICSLK